MARVLRSAPAQEDLYEIWKYIADKQQSPAAADHVLTELGRIAELLAITPLIGTDAARFRAGLRMCPKWNYILFYEPIDDGILLHRVLHGARNLEELF